MPLPSNHPLSDGRTSNAPLIQAARGMRPDRVPVWFMRQAGRSLPEYKRTRADISMLDACLDPAMAAELTLQPVRRHGVDAGIFFSDIVVPVLLAGVNIDIVPGRGPVIGEPIRDLETATNLPELTPVALAPIREAVSLCVNELNEVPLIGFAGGPFTVASYLVEGGPSRDKLSTRRLMHADPTTWHRLADWVTRCGIAHLIAQIESGASAVQLFDSWAGFLSARDYKEFVAPYSARVFSALAEYGIPRIHFGLGTSHLLTLMQDVGADVVGIDYRTNLARAVDLLDGCPVQGNIDPALLTAPRETLFAHATSVVQAGRGASGHIVNLGHGVPPDTDPEVLTDLTAHLHSLR